jgi:hypothetical protein
VFNKLMVHEGSVGRFICYYCFEAVVDDDRLVHLAKLLMYVRMLPADDWSMYAVVWVNYTLNAK